ncbi:hypothetical protein CANARDRAFT_30017 [[Candida] arabinofermentans NRRL YB-2248]|uniref:Uncharacterized protein n=1 Tax=[Candida] arabinofermentans NRRL YB-2248 TaxID=983967 RepID=A0A1E4SV75_9ASCO|nr:hypothetical protein CANARDRAFT_30017 [[Candida] arabinofermentans NRRL YB-2248]
MASASSYSLVGTANVAGSASASSSSSSSGAAGMTTPMMYSGSNSKLVTLFAGLVALGAVVSAL